jgi:glycosyltransferase involved in cell wall biosynthesis
MKYLFLYTELAGYTVNCFQGHLSRYPEDEIAVVHYPVNPEAPFDFQEIPGVKYYLKDKIGLDGIFELVREFNPDLILCSGWADREYVKIARILRSEHTFVLCFDNMWLGTLRQRLLLPIGKYILKPLFSFCWVPGVPQKKFALKLGFKSDQVFSGFYATDTKLFENLRLQKAAYTRPVNDKKRLLCVARYIPEKGYDFLWKAFQNLYSKGFEDWELWCVGTGELFNERIEHAAIRHLGFLQPEELDYVVKNCDVFVLPSLFEPWGMAVQEFAAAGFPLVLSSAVGSRTAFLEENVNGVLFEAGNQEDLEAKLRQMMTAGNDEWNRMSARSAELAEANNAENWSETLRKMGLID